jgi:hypothetical protein
MWGFGKNTAQGLYGLLGSQGPTQQFGPSADMVNVLRNPPSMTPYQGDPVTGGWQAGYQQNQDANLAALNNWNGQIGMQHQLDWMNQQQPPTTNQPTVNPSISTPPPAQQTAPAATPVATPDQSPSLNQTINQAMTPQQLPGQLPTSAGITQPQAEQQQQQQQQYGYQPQQTQTVLDTLRQGAQIK